MMLVGLTALFVEISNIGSMSKSSGVRRDQLRRQDCPIGAKDSFHLTPNVVSCRSASDSVAAA